MSTSVTIPARSGDEPALSALLDRPADAGALLVLAHGAGAGMTHRFMAAVAERLARRGLATLRYQFPYMERGSRRPDRASQLVAAVRRAIDVAADLAGPLPLLAGGKSMGGRMTSTALAEAPDPRVRGVVFLGFPLHPARKPATTRAEHLASVESPMLFVQGTRDALAELPLLEPIVTALGPRATLHVCDGADHGFDVLKRSGRDADDVLDEIADTTVGWLAALG